MQKWLVLVLVVCVGVVLAACSSTPEESSEMPPVEVTIVATDLAYDVERIELVAGQELLVTLRNDGALEHDFSIQDIPLAGEVIASETGEDMAGHDMEMLDEEPVVHVAAAAGGTETVRFTPSVAGEYPYYCTVEGHREAGMAGTLVVSAP